MTLVDYTKSRKDYSRLWNGQSSMLMRLQDSGLGLHGASFSMVHLVAPKLLLPKLLLILLKQLFSLSGADLYSMYVGEGEALLRDTFRQARLATPSIIFFDEANAVASRRGVGENGSSGGGSDTSVGEKLLSTLLTEMDGLELAQGVLVLAATNRPQAIDAALMRPGRFDSTLASRRAQKKPEFFYSPIPQGGEAVEATPWGFTDGSICLLVPYPLGVFYVPPPDKESRLEILHVHTRRNTLADDVDLEIVADGTECFTGAELAGLCREAVMAALRESLATNTASNVVCQRHFDSARYGTRASLTPLQIASYANFKAKK